MWFLRIIITAIIRLSQNRGNYIVYAAKGIIKMGAFCSKSIYTLSIKIYIKRRETIIRQKEKNKGREERDVREDNSGDR